jgi:glycosyltransferase involved in cell wall biosynthesis
VSAFDVCLIPYDTSNPFNQACCPTKIMDYMASTRPVVATDLPECRLHEGLFDVAPDAESFVAAVAEILAHGGDDGRATARWATARRWTWEEATRTLIRQFLDRASLGTA